MIRPSKQGVVSWLWQQYAGWCVRGAFRGVWLRGELPRGGGLFIYANHPSWWDGFVAHELGRVAGWDTYAMMDEANLAKYRFLSRIGAVSLRPGDASSSLQSFKVARGLARGASGAVFIFPQGELRPGAELGPLRRGVELLARGEGLRAAPLALRYVMLEHERPDVLVSVGQSHGPTTLNEYQRRLGEQVDGLANVNSTAGFSLLIRGRRGLHEWWSGKSNI